MRLERDFCRPGKVVAAIMVNPSKASAEIDDHTIRKWHGFSDRHSFSKVIIGNKFAYCATDIIELRHVEDAVGPDNDRHLEQIMRDADFHIVAWGRLSKLPKHLRNRWRTVVDIADRVGCRLHCFGTGIDGHPLHPLTLAYDTPIVPWEPPV
ncbi:DUF1643 domain-containing protein [Mesorhizobium sp. L-8-10]|uniref:DUF1643 domain-containing protein n=1 Tax=Mesorhizobium sp. L-8-10 TaxID=2744523 RepID=UPI001FD5C582|nr:DUF1643 domain-containing protein [Mesorhizobium sp. L-8-10]